MTQHLRLIVFPAAFNWPIWVAAAKGFFARQGVAVEVTPTPGSVFQLTGLIEGRFDLAITLADNVVAYREGQGEVPLAGPDLVALMGADARTWPSLVTLPGLARYEDLRGKILSVDATKTGLVIILRALLARGGLQPGDYTLDSVGGVKERYAALLEHRHAGALFNSPFEGMLRDRGFTVLDHAGTVLPRVQNHVIAARRSWAEAHRPAVVGFLRAYLEAVAWLYEPGNVGAAIDVFRAESPGTDVAAGEAAYRILFDAKDGFPRDGAIDMAGLAHIVALRERFGEPPRVMQPPEAYVDTRFLDQAHATP